MHFYFEHLIIPKIQKHIYFFACTTKTQKYHYLSIFTLLHCYLIYHLAYHIYFYLHSHLVLDNHSVESGTQERGIVLQVAGRRTSGAFLTVPREFDINPEFPSWEKFTHATTLCTWSPNLAHLLSVIKTIFWAVAREQRKEFTTASFIKWRKYSDARSSSRVGQSPKLGEVTPL
jgi:hypothetical protein